MSLRAVRDHRRGGDPGPYKQAVHPRDLRALGCDASDPRVFNIVHAENPGAAFGCSRIAPALARALLVGVSVVVMTGSE